MELKILKSKEDGKDVGKYVQKDAIATRMSPGVITLRLSKSN